MHDALKQPNRFDPSVAFVIDNMVKIIACQNETVSWTQNEKKKRKSKPTNKSNGNKCVNSVEPK
jgi:hypothetical protein